jgi:predicted nucleic acid-binding protein
VVHTVVVEPPLAAILDPDEAEAIALARAVQARVVILDDYLGGGLPSRADSR